MAREGWVKLHRKLTEKAIWKESTPEQKTILITLLLMANHRDMEWEWKGERYVARPGQFITSLESIVEKCGKGVSMQNVRTAIKRFEKYEFLTNESTNKNRLITIVNWSDYQGGVDEPNKESNKQLTSNQQATNKQLTTNKNVKNVKNEKKNTLTSSQGDDDRVPHQEIVDLFNEMLGGVLPKAEKLTKSRRNKIRIRWHEGLDDIDKWKSLYGEVKASDFLMGDKTDWKASFDWLIANDKNWVKVKEGNYRNEEETRKSRDRSEPEEGSGYIEIL